ncbi:MULTISPECIES: glycosyl hydrolase [Bacillaceae]|uniref:glycosyl hydrolase n=1 Tax=Bacillaceae TaxID=186817 RepID=UPI00047A3CA0|nr:MULTISPECIES: glycosyl hydrolase [Bacillaceae]
MNQKIKKLLNNEGNNYILPFFWLHGEEESVLREYMEAIQSAGIGAVCVESRPHPDYCGPQWWRDMDIILDEAKKRNMKVWILDDSHFPTGFANGALEDAPAELCRQFLYYSSIEVIGPAKSAQLNVAKHVKYVKNPFETSMFSMRAKKERRQFDDDTLLSVCAARIDQDFDASTLIDITELVKDGELVWDVPEGKWIIYVNYLTRNAGSRDNYINMLNHKSARKQIEAVYEPHLERYKEEFGKTIAGFFSDEPELGNGKMNANQPIGTDTDLPWSEEVEVQMKERLGANWKTKLPLLWEDARNTDQTAEVRYVYMDIITRLVEENFSKQIGNWCEEHGVEYIGHLIEDNNMHARTGPSLGHFFRGLSGQHMSGIDDIGGQVMPGGEIYPKKTIIGDRDGEFFHYMLGKLGSSFAAIDPIKKGRTMCEIFGAYGWGEGVRMMKYLVDHFLVRGVNHYVPHAFSAKPYPDPDCPPHFYANGHDPQFRHFGALMRYLNRMCALISDGKRVTSTAILYHAEAEWAGEYMLNQKPAHVLMDNQIDFDILPSDVFTELDRFKTKIGKHLHVNNQEYKSLIIPYSQYVTESTAKAVIELNKAGHQVLFINNLPSGIVDGDNTLLEELSSCKVVTLETLVSAIKENAAKEISVEPAFSMLRYLHYREESDLYLFTNENMAETFVGTITVPNTGPVYGYDVWNNELYEVRADHNEEGTVLSLEIPPSQSVVVVFDKSEEIEVKSPVSFDQEITLEDGWTMSFATSIEYPNFHDTQEVSSLENIGLKYPEFSGFIRYENEVETPLTKQASLRIDDAFEGVEVFINDESVGIQIAPPFVFDISKQLREGKNKVRIEVATTLEREQHFRPLEPGNFFAAFAKAPMLQPTGIVGDVKILVQK